MYPPWVCFVACVLRSARVSFDPSGEWVCLLTGVSLDVFLWWAPVSLRWARFSGKFLTEIPPGIAFYCFGRDVKTLPITLAASLVLVIFLSMAQTSVSTCLDVSAAITSLLLEFIVGVIGGFSRICFGKLDHFGAEIADWFRLGLLINVACSMVLCMQNRGVLSFVNDAMSNTQKMRTRGAPLLLLCNSLCAP